MMKVISQINMLEITYAMKLCHNYKFAGRKINKTLERAAQHQSMSLEILHEVAAEDFEFCRASRKIHYQLAN